MADEVNDQAIFDSVTDRSGTREIDEVAPATTTPAEKADSSTRDDHGRFAPKAPAAEATATEGDPATIATPAEPDQSGMVPQQALHETRQKLKDEQEARAALERRIAAMEQATRAPATPAEPPRAPDPWDPDFADYQRNQVETAIQKQKMATSQLLAVDKFGSEVVSAAETALEAAVKADPSVMGDVRRILASPHPYAETVAWHKAQAARARVGSDPDAFVQAEIEKMIRDPGRKAELLARLTGVPAAVDSTSTNVTRLPPSLSKISTAAGGVPQGGAGPSDAELFAQVTRR